MAALADSSKRWHIALRCTICGPLGLLLFEDVHLACGKGRFSEVMLWIILQYGTPSQPSTKLSAEPEHQTHGPGRIIPPRTGQQNTRPQGHVQGR